MKKLLALVLAMMLVCLCIPAMAEETPEGYPEVVPGIDFGGQQIYIYDYYSSNSDDRKAEPSEEEQAQYDYRDWIMKTYNCKITQIQNGDWEHVDDQFQQAFKNSEKYQLWILPPDYVGSFALQNMFADWADNDLVDVHDTSRWVKYDTDFMTRGDQVLGVTPGEFAEPRQCIFFNVEMVKAAGIEPDELYDCVANGEWTWAKFREYLAKVQKDVDGDDVIDIWGLSGDFNDMLRGYVFNNGGSFFEVGEDGRLNITIDSPQTIAAVTEALDLNKEFFYQGVADETTGQVPYGYFKDAWKDGTFAFYAYQTYGGFNDNAEMYGGPEWGCLPYPVGPDGDTYYHICNDNITVLPNLYLGEDKELGRNLQYIYDLWSAATPGYDDDDAWIGNKYNYTDDRAVDETYANLRSWEHTKTDATLNLGGTNDVLGEGYLWSLSWAGTPQEVTEAKLPALQARVAEYNQKLDQ